MTRIAALVALCLTMIHQQLPVAIQGAAPEPKGSLGCFADSAADHELGQLAYMGSANSHAVCRDACTPSDYFALQNGDQCFCGNGFTGRYGPGNGSVDCRTPCPAEVGLSAAKCGGVGFNSVFQQPAHGCFADTGTDRDRQFLAYDGSPFNSYAFCRAACSQYKFFALQNGSRCLCGDDYRVRKVGPSANCDVACSGDANAMCGGANASTVYKMKNPSLGCFKDDATERDLTVQADLLANSGVNNSFAACRVACASYKFFGLQNGSQCFCGDTFGWLGRASDCNVPCPGDAAEMCGGESSNTIYEHRPLGCFADDRATAPDRTILAYDNATANGYSQCRAACGQYRFFALLNGSACLCGNKFGSRGLANNCHAPCPNNEFEHCGGVNASLVYENLPLGCFVDDETNRDLANRTQDLGEVNSYAQCRAKCAEFAYFGLQNGTLCTCGDRYASLGTSPAGCSVPCPGDATAICGGANANSVYLVI